MGHFLRAFFMVPERQMNESAIDLLNELTLEGLPVVAFGAGRGLIAWEFRWALCAGETWRWHAERCVTLMDRLSASLRR